MSRALTSPALSLTHTKAATPQWHPFLLLFRVLSDNCGQMKVEREQKHETQWFPIRFFPCLRAKNYTIMSFSWCAHQQEWKPHLSSFRLIENQSLGNSAGLSALLLSSRTAERRQQEHRANESYWTLMPALTVEIHRKNLCSSAFQSNLRELFIKFPCRQDVNMPLKSANTIMKTDTCNCICVVPLTQS